MDDQQQQPEREHVIENEKKLSDLMNNNDLTSSYNNIESISSIVEEQMPATNGEINEDEYEILNKNDEQLSEKLEEVEETKEPPAVLDVLGNGSLIKKVLKRGERDQRPTNGQLCTIAYELRLASDLEKIVEQNDAFEFILGDGDVVPAMDIAVSLMDLNEECEVTTEARHAYGEKGELPKIPENAKLVYKLRLDKYEYGPEMNKLDTIERLSMADVKKQRGNYHYNRQNYEQAVASYRKGLKYFLDYNLNGNETKEDLDKFNEVKVTLNMNVALSNYKLQSYTDALEALDNVLKFQSRHVKALFIKGKILAHVGDLADAIQCFNKALEIDDKNADIAKELARAQSKYKIQYAKEKEMYQKMISGVGSTPESNTTTTTTSIKKSNDKKKPKSNNNNNNNNSTFFTYLTTAGVIVAIASIGFAAYAKYKNLI